MMHVDRKKVGVRALVVALVVVLAALRPGPPAERSEANFPVGGIAALPSALPAVVPVALANIPGVPQQVPAIAPASGPGSFALVSAFCEGDYCPHARGGPAPPDGPPAPIEFTMSKVWPPGAPVAATFTANGEQTLLCADDTTCDLTDPTPEGQILQHVAVGLTGGGENEVIDVTACDITGDCRTVTVIFVETMLVLPLPTGVASASAELPTLVSYRCDDVGLYGALADRAPAGTGQVLGGTPVVSFEEVFNWFYGWPNIGTAQLRHPVSVPPLEDIRFYNCGGDTNDPQDPNRFVDDRVTFETDLGILSVEAAGDAGSMPAPGFPFRPFGSLTTDCDAGDSVDVLDHPGPVLDTRGTLFAAGPDIPGTYCDLDFAPNGVVSYLLWGTGETGVATVTGQQSGGGGVLRTGYPSFAGLAAASLVMEAPEVIGLEGGEFSLAVVDADLRFLSGQTVACSAEPLDAVLAITPQTATSGQLPEPFVNFTVFPTRTAVETGVDVAITCFLDSNPDVRVTATARIGKPAETVELVAVEEGCSPLSSTWPDGTDVQQVVGAVAPADALKAIWRLADPATGAWLGWSADVPAEENDLQTFNFLDSLFFCVSGEAELTRPLVRQ